MANAIEYVFPMVTAIQCIPEFNGKSQELRPFLLQIDYFANAFPADADQTALLNVVYTKMKGEALMRLQEIEDNTWDAVKDKLEKVFKLEKSIGSIINEIETLRQSGNESFHQFKMRGLKLYHHVKDDSFACEVLRKHFLAGLQNQSLALAGKSQREKSFPELLKWLQTELEEEEELEELRYRLRWSNSKSDSRNYQKGNNENERFKAKYENDYKCSYNKISYDDHRNHSRNFMSLSNTRSYRRGESEAKHCCISTLSHENITNAEHENSIRERVATDKITELNQITATLRNENKYMEVQLEKSTNRCKELESKNRTMETKFKQRAEENAYVALALKECQVEIDELHRTLRQIESESKRWKKDCYSLQEDNRKLQEDNLALKEIKNELQIKLEEQKKWSEQQLMSVITDNSIELEAKEKKWQNKLDILKAENTHIQHVRETLEENLMEYEKECSNLRKSNVILRGEIKKLETIKENNEDSIITLKKQMEVYNELNKNLEDEMKEVNKKLKEVFEENEKSGVKIRNYDKALNTKDKIIKDLQMALEKLNSIKKDDTCKEVQVETTTKVFKEIEDKTTPEVFKEKEKCKREALLATRNMVNFRDHVKRVLEVQENQGNSKTILTVDVKLRDLNRKPAITQLSNNTDDKQSRAVNTIITPAIEKSYMHIVSLPETDFLNQFRVLSELLWDDHG